MVLGVVLTCFFASFLLSYITVLAYANRVLKFGLDKAEKVQKMHTGSVPRVGGFAIFCSLICGSLFLGIGGSEVEFLILILISALPVVSAGLIEDCFGCLTPMVRLCSALLSGLLLTQMGDLIFRRTELLLIDQILEYEVIAVFLTVMGVATLVNGVNIVDGFNGLAAAFCLSATAGFFIIGYRESDSQLMMLALSFGSALFGFALFNYPSGRIFLGDSGAYLCGFFIAILALLSVKNENVSPAAVFFLVAYPGLEVLYSFTRKLFSVSAHPFTPDRKHLHILIYRIVVHYVLKRLNFYGEDLKFLANNAVVVVMLPFILAPLIVTSVQHSNTFVLFFWLIGYSCAYVILATALTIFSGGITEE